jgi:hypothetical protein
VFDINFIPIYQNPTAIGRSLLSELLLLGPFSIDEGKYVGRAGIDAVVIISRRAPITAVSPSMETE